MLDRGGLLRLRVVWGVAVTVAVSSRRASCEELKSPPCRRQDLWEDRIMRRKPSAKVASAGVTHTQMAIEDDLGWLFRLQPTEDYGIDAQVEIVDGQDVSGKLLALQIKGGTSWFKEPGVNGWWFRPDVEHVQYWTKHSLPVVVVLYDPGTGRCPMPRALG